MRNTQIVKSLLFWCCVFVGPVVFSGVTAGFTDIIFSETPFPEVRYVSGNTLYVEALLGDRWVGRYWSADGLSNIPDKASLANQPLADSAFELTFRRSLHEPELPLTRGWQWIGASELPKTDSGGRHFVVELLNRLRPINIKIHTVLDGTPVLTRWLEITNVSDRPDGLSSVSPWTGPLWLKEASFTLGRAEREEVPFEGWFGWSSLKAGLSVFANRADRLWDDPYFIVRNEANGEYFFGQLAWAANYRMEFENNNGLSFKISPVADHFLRSLSPDETIVTPAVHLGHVKNDFDLIVQSMHDHIRRSVLPEQGPEKSYLIQYLIPEDWGMTVYRGDEFNESNMRKCIDVAASVGIEVFILDGPMWVSGYGNWLVPHKTRFPRGLAPLAEYAHQKGMLFGVYAESEGGRDGDTSAFWDGGATIGRWKESKVYNEHPEWFDSMNLNLAIPGAEAYLENEISRMIDLHKLDLYRHDQNGIVFYPPGPGAGQTLQPGRLPESNYWRHYDALYGIFNRLHAKYPDVIFQQAAAGNFRLDLGTIGAFREHFTSDGATMPIAYQRLSGLSVYLPPEIMVNSNGMGWPKDLPDLDTTLRGAYATGNTPMIFNSVLPRTIEELTPEVREKFLHYTNIYKNFIRPMLSTCKVFHHAPVNSTGGVESGDWFAMEFGSPDRKKAWATIIRMKKSKSGSETYHLLPKGLDDQMKYRVTFDNTGKAKVFEGAFLLREGLEIRLGEDCISELLLFESI